MFRGEKALYNHTGLPVESLGQILGRWKDGCQSLQEETQLVFPYREINRLQTIPSPPLCVKAAAPFVKRHNFDGDESKMERDMSGWDGTERRGAGKKKSLLCKPDGFFLNQNEQVMEKGGCSGTVWERENRRENSTPSGTTSNAEPSGRKRRRLRVILHREYTMWGYSFTFVHALHTKKGLSQWSDAKSTARRFAACFPSQARSQYGRQ